MKTVSTLSVAGLLLLSGCQTYEISPVPPGHPASIDAAPAPHQRSTTLEPTTPVDPKGRASDHFGNAPKGQDPHAGHGGSSAQGAQDPPTDPSSSSVPQVCPVSGQKLGSMGKPVVIEHEGRYLMLCCAGCVDAFKQDPERYLKAAEQGAPTHDTAPAQPAPNSKPDHSNH